MRGPSPLLTLSLLLSLGCGESAPSSLPTGGSNGAGGDAGNAGSGAASAGSTQASARAAGADGGAGGNAGGATGGASTAGAAPGEPGASKLGDCELALPYVDEQPRGHWLGGDSNFSVVLGPSLALMTFQDTFVGGPSTSSRSGSVMVGSSLASLGCEEGELVIDYAWGGDAQDHQAMFDDQNPQGDRLWVHRPWLHQGKLFLTATRVSSDDQGFAEHGMTLARVQNPLEAPADWSIEYFNLTDQRLTVGKGIADTEQHVYLFTPYDANMILARIAKARLLEPTLSEASLEYLKTDGTWGAGLVPSGAKKLGIAANTGLTVRYHAASERWLALYTNTDGWPSAIISVSSAAALEGPWSAPQELYSVPEMDPEAPEFDADTICYGASEHDAFNPDPDGQIVLTYTCNSSDFTKLLANMAIYVPRVVKLGNPLLP